MSLRLLDIVDWEPAVLRWKHPKSIVKIQIENFASNWLKDRSGLKICDCDFRFAMFDYVGELTIMRAEWMCIRCCESFSEALITQFNQIFHVKLGIPLSPKEQQWIKVPEQRIELEDGTQVTVESFEVSKYPVTVQEFELFTKKASYTTTAEMKKLLDTFRDNCMYSGLSENSRNNASVSMMSYQDASAYCNCFGYRLPSEAEWLASSVLDWKEYQPGEILEKLSQPLPAHAIIPGGCEFTSTWSPEGKVIMRVGPFHYLSEGWKKPQTFRANRLLVGVNEADVPFTFRVIRCTRRTG